MLALKSGWPRLEAVRPHWRQIRSRIPVAVFLDATYRKARDNRRVVSQAVVVATAVRADGNPEVLGFNVGDSEDGAFWTAFLYRQQSHHGAIARAAGHAGTGAVAGDLDGAGRCGQSSWPGSILGGDDQIIDTPSPQTRPRAPEPAGLMWLGEGSRASQPGEGPWRSRPQSWAKLGPNGLHAASTSALERPSLPVIASLRVDLHRSGGQGVAGSNPVSPTESQAVGIRR